MPEIKIPFSTTPWEPAIQQNRMDPNVATMPYKAALEGINEYYNNAQRVGDMQTQLAMTRARTQEGIGKAIGSAFGIAGGLADAYKSEQRHQEAEARRIENERKAHEREVQHFLDKQIAIESNRFAVTELAKANLDMQDIYQKALNSAPADPTGFTENVMGQLDIRAKALLAQAPNEQAALHAMQAINSMKAHYQQQAFNFEAKGRQNYQSVAADNFLNQAVNQTARNPELKTNYLQQYVDQLSLYNKGGMTNAEVNQRILEGASKLTAAEMSGKATNNPQQLMEDMAKGVYDNVAPNVYQSANKLALKMNELQKRIDFYNSGQAVPNTKEWKDAADASFEAELGAIEDKDPVKTAENYLNKMAKNPSLIPPMMVDKISGMINFGSDLNREIGSKIIRKMQENPDLRIALNDFDSKTVKRADFYGWARENGADPKEAKDYMTKQEAAMNTERKKALEEAIKLDENIKNENVDKLFKSEFGSWFGTTNVDPIAKKLFTDKYTENMMVYNQPDWAKKAALNDIKRMYKVTEINGYKQMAINPVPDQYVSAIQDDVMKLLGEKFPQKFGKDELAKDKVLGIFSKKNPDHKIFFDVRSNMQDPKTGIWHIPIYEQIKGLPVPVLDPDSGYQPLELQFKMPEPKEKVQLEEDLKRWKEISIYNEKRREENDFGRSIRLRIQQWQAQKQKDLKEGKVANPLETGGGGPNEDLSLPQDTFVEPTTKITDNTKPGSTAWKEQMQLPEIKQKIQELETKSNLKQENWNAKIDQVTQEPKSKTNLNQENRPTKIEKAKPTDSVEEINKKIDQFNALAEKGFSSEQAYIDAKNKMGLTDSLLEKYRRGR